MNTSIRVMASPMDIILGIFLFLGAIVVAVAPLPLLYRSLGILILTYTVFITSGMPFAYLVALIAPPVGLITNSTDWLIMLPIILASGLLGMLGLEYAWRYAAILVSPLLYIIPQFFVSEMSQRDLFRVELPWEPAASTWINTHLLVAFAGVLVAVYIDRRRQKGEG